MNNPVRGLRTLLVVTAIGLSSLAAGAADDPGLISQGKEIFRFDTFGDEQLWTDKLGLHKVVEQKVDPTTALKMGLKVDSEALPPGILEKVDLKSPATTVALLKLNAVVGLKAEVDANNRITRLGVTCATCHVGGNGTDNESGKLHAPADTGMDGTYAMRTANRAFRTTPLRGLQHHPPYFHDGSAKTLGDVVEHYNKERSLNLTKDQLGDLVEYLKSL